MSDDGSIPIQILSATSTSGGNIALQIFLIIFLVFLNAFFASSEIALLSVNDTKLKKEAENGNKKSARLLKIVENPSKFLSTIQVGVTFSGFLNSAVASSSFADIITAKLASSWSFAASHTTMINTICIVVITMILSFITLVFGELVPKRYAMKYSDKVAKSSVKPLKFTGILFSPFIKIVTLSVNGVLKLVGINPNEDTEEVTEEEILLMVNEGQEKGVIGDDESEMISNILEFDDKTAMDVMTHRTEIAAINITDDYDKILDTAVTERYSRFPVYETSIDNIIGIIHIKDLLRVNKDTFNLNDIMRMPSYVPESQKIDDVFDALKDNNTHMAVVVDEFGGTMGIVTMEDIIEELIGDVFDEHDEISDDYKELEDGSFIVNCSTELDNFIEKFELKLDDEEDIPQTLNGFIMKELQTFPHVGDTFDYQSLKFEITKIGPKRIEEVHVTKIQEDEKGAE